MWDKATLEGLADSHSDLGRLGWWVQKTLEILVDGHKKSKSMNMRTTNLWFCGLTSHFHTSRQPKNKGMLTENNWRGGRCAVELQQSSYRPSTTVEKKFLENCSTIDVQDDTRSWDVSRVRMILIYFGLVFGLCHSNDGLLWEFCPSMDNHLSCSPCWVGVMRN
jgi:hypothetical protein